MDNRTSYPSGCMCPIQYWSLLLYLNFSKTHTQVVATFPHFNKLQRGAKFQSK